MMRPLRLLATFMVLVLLSAVSFAQDSSKRPIRILVASPPGGPSDTQIRLLLPKMGEALKRTLIVDNRPSNNGVLATEITAQAAPDGHTFCVGNSGTHAVNATLYLKLPYDPVRDFAPVSQFSTTGLIVTGNPRLPGNSIHDLVALAKKEPGRLNVSIAGATGELAGDALWAQLHIKMTNVRYKGSAPATLAVLTGETDVSMLTALAILAHVKAGKLKAYGITSVQRSPLLPEVPTLAEQGVEGYEVQFWNGLFAPAKTPPAVVQAVNRSVVFALQDPEVKERFKQLGLVIVGNTPQEFAAVVKKDVAKFRKVILESGIPRL